MSLDKLLAAAGAIPVLPDPDAELLLAVQLAASELAVLLASDDDGDDDSKGGDDGDADDSHAGHATYKALIKRKVPPERAAAMCARSDKKVKATALAQSLEAMLSGRPGVDIGLVTLTPASETAAGRRKAAKNDHALPDGSYPIEDKAHLHKAATLAASKHGDWQSAKSLIRRRARDLGVDVNSLPGFGSTSDSDGEKVAAAMLELARREAGADTVPMHHAPMTGRHSHPHVQTSAHEHDHEHFGDNNHSGGPLHRPGSKPPGWGRDW
jgi:hypothetical protein